MRRPGFLAGTDYWFNKWKKGDSVRKAAGVDQSLFQIVEGESKQARLHRLREKGLYTSGQAMDIDYSNLVHYGTTDRNKIAAIRQAQVEWQRQENLKRYGTSDIKQIMKIVSKKS